MPRSSSDTQVEQKQNDNSKDDGGEDGQQKPEQQGPVGFWSPDLKNVRKTVFKKWAITSLSMGDVDIQIANVLQPFC